MAAPNLFDAPVTTATLPFKSLMELLAKKSAGQPRRWSRKPRTTDNSHVGRLQLARPKKSLLHFYVGALMPRLFKRQAGEHVGEPGLRIDVVEPRSLD